MSNPLTLHLLRHGEVFNPDKVLYGRLPGFILSEKGRAQAQAAGDWLADQAVTTVYASPMERAQETARLAVARFAQPLPIATDERLNECSTPHQGRPLAALELIEFEIYDGNEHPHETVADLRQRLQAFIADMRTQHPNSAVVGVTHGDMQVAGLLLAAGVGDHTIGRGELEPIGLPVRYPTTATIISLRYTTSDPNEVPQWTYTDPHNT